MKENCVIDIPDFFSYMYKMLPCLKENMYEENFARLKLLVYMTAFYEANSFLLSGFSIS